MGAQTTFVQLGMAPEPPMAPLSEPPFPGSVSEPPFPGSVEPPTAELPPVPTLPLPPPVAPEPAAPPFAPLPFAAAASSPCEVDLPAQPATESDAATKTAASRASWLTETERGMLLECY